MKFLKITASALALTAFAGAAQAQVYGGDGSGAYINLGVDAVEFDAYTLSGKLGYDLSDYFGLEAQAGFGISDSDENIDDIVGDLRVNGSGSVGIDNFVAGFAKLQFPVSDRVDVFARGGYHFTQIGVETSDFTVTGAGINQVIRGTEDNLDTDGIAVGAGAQFMLNDMNGIRIEYTYFDIDDIDGFDGDDFDDVDFGNAGSDLYSISYVRKF